MPADEVAGTRDVPEWERQLLAEHGDRLQPLPRDAKPITWADIGDAQPDADQRAANTVELEAFLGPKPWHSDPGEPCEHPHCVAKAAQPGAAPAPICGAREVGGPAVCTREPGHPRDVHEQQIGLGVLRWACEVEDAAPAPDGNAGGVDAYGPAQDNPGTHVLPRNADALKAAYDQGVDRSGPGQFGHDWGLRAVADAARAPLLVELAEAGESMYDYQHAATRADEQLDQARTDRDVAEREMGRYRQEALDLAAELAEAIRERDEARAKTDGGEHPCLPLIVIGETFGGGLDARCGNCGTYQSIGSGGEMTLAELKAFLDAHCEPVTDDGPTT